MTVPSSKGAEAQMVGDEGVEHAERVEEAAPPAAFEAVAAADIGAGGRHVAEAVHDQHGRLLERRGEEDGGVGVVMADLDDRRQPGEAEPPAQLVLEPERQEHDAAVLRRVRARPQQAEAGGQVAQDGLGERPAQRPRVPGRRHDVDVADAELQLRQGGLEREQRELEGVLLPAEPLLLQHKGRDAVLQQGDAAVMACRRRCRESSKRGPLPGRGDGLAAMLEQPRWHGNPCRLAQPDFGGRT